MFQKLKRMFGGPGSELILADGSAPDQQLQSDAKSPARLGYAVLIAGFGSFILWAVTAPIDEGVPAPGSVVQESKRKTVQHLGGGLVAEIPVREGQWVEAGQVLVRLRDTQAKANHDAAQHRFYSLGAMQARLEAEQRGAASVSFPPALTGSSNPLAQQHLAAQRELFLARQRALQSDLAVLQESGRSAADLAKGMDEQLAFMNKEIAGLRDLSKEGYVARNQQLAAERQLIEITNNAMRARSQVAELRLRENQRQQEFRRDVEAQLAEVTREASLATQQLRAAEEELSRTVILAPEAGQVVGIFSQMTGAVVTPGQRLMDIVPKDEALILEVHVPPTLIDKVHTGLAADVNLHAFANTLNGPIEGEVISIAGDLLSEQVPGGISSFYLARVKVTPAGMKTLGDRQLQPGMPADVVIKTGERTMMNYIMHPLLRRLQSSLTES